MPTDDKATWNYRVVEDTTQYGSVFTIYTVRYEGKKITSFCRDVPSGLSPEELRGNLEQMLQAFDLPVLSKRELDRIV